MRNMTDEIMKVLCLLLRFSLLLMIEIQLQFSYQAVIRL